MGNTLEQKGNTVPTLCYIRYNNSCLPGAGQPGPHRIPVIQPKPSRHSEPHLPLFSAFLHASETVSPRVTRAPQKLACSFSICSAFLFHVMLCLAFRHLLLEHNARLVCFTDNDATGNIEEGQRCIVFFIGCAYHCSVVSMSCQRCTTCVPTLVTKLYVVFYDIHTLDSVTLGILCLCWA